jgi:hypothetical protein
MTPRTEVGNRLMLVKAEGMSEGAAIPFPIRAWWAEEPSLPVDVEMLVDASTEADVLEVRELHLRHPSGRGITSAMLRQVPITRLLNEAIECSARPVSTDAKGRPQVTWPDLAGLMGAPAPVRTAPPSEALRVATDAKLGTRREPLDDDVLRGVAKVYRESVESRLSTRKEIMKRCGAGSQATAGRWVMEARRRGFLGPADGTRAGEAPTRKGK